MAIAVYPLAPWAFRGGLSEFRARCRTAADVRSEPGIRTDDICAWTWPRLYRTKTRGERGFCGAACGGSSACPGQRDIGRDDICGGQGRRSGPSLRPFTKAAVSILQSVLELARNLRSSFCAGSHPRAVPAIAAPAERPFQIRSVHKAASQAMW